MKFSVSTTSFIWGFSCLGRRFGRRVERSHADLGVLRVLCGGELVIF
jgi:hypothetical protein